jgi:hypothetical protein
VARRLGVDKVSSIQSHEEARSRVSAPRASGVDVEVLRPRAK